MPCRDKSSKEKMLKGDTKVDLTSKIRELSKDLQFEG